MPTKEERRAEAAKHLALMKGAFAAETQAAIDSAVVYEDGDAAALELPEPRRAGTTTATTSDFATKAVRRATGKVLVVDPMSFTRPGGNYEDGGFGPEQILCAESNLYPVLRGLKKTFHDANRGYACGQLFTGRALYLSDIVFNYDGDVVRADVLAIAEPNRQRALENHRSARECDCVLADRVEAIMRAAAAHDIDTLVVNAFGCGREAGDEDLTIRLFKEWIEAHPGAVGSVVFAVPRAHFGAFADAFGVQRIRRERPAEEAPAARAEGDAARTGADAGSDGDDFDWRSVKLPEGVVVR